MRTEIKIIVAVFLLSLLSCSKNNDGVCFSSAGKNSSETRIIADFKSMEVSNKIDIEFYPHSGRNAVELAGPENLLAGCYTTIEDGILKVGNHNKCNWLRDYDKKVKLKIYGEKLDTLILAGGGNIVFKDTMHVERFMFLGLESSGDLDLLLDSKEAYIKLNTGTTDVTLHGSSDYLYYYSLTTGFIFGRDFQCKESLVVQRGYGDVYINPSENIYGEITRQGNIYYPGKIKADVRITGSGRLIEFEN